jgi:hypothetical protein
MMTLRNSVAPSIVAVAALAAASLANAHHSFSMFDSSKELVLKGEVVRWNFASPHTYMLLKDEAGNVWSLEGTAPPTLITRTPAMTGDTFKAGDKMTIVYCPLRDGRKGGANGIIITADGTVYNPSDGGCRANQRIGDWPAWIKKGYTSLDQAKAREGIK